MQRIASLNNQFESAMEQLPKPMDEQFTDAWAYLDMDQFMSERGLYLRDRVRQFSDRIEVSKDNSSLT